MKYFPIFLSFENRSAVVFGGGADAAAKLRLLQKTDAPLYVVASHLNQDVLDLKHATWIKSAPLEFTLPRNTVLVYAATGDARLDRQLVVKAQAKGILACAVDQPSSSDFLTPAIVDRDPIIVAIGTEGTAPVLARDLKSKIESQLEPSLGAVAKAAARLRPLVAKITEAGGQRRAFWHTFFRRARVQPACAAEIGHNLLANLRPTKARLSFIDAPAGQASLDQAGRAALHAADLVIFGTDVASSVLELARREARQVRYDKLRNDQVAEALSSNQHVVLLRRRAGQDHLSEIAAGFGVVAEVFPRPPAYSSGNVTPFAKAA